MNIIGVEPAKGQDDYISNFYLKNLYLVYENGTKERLSPFTPTFHMKFPDLSKDIQRQVMEMIQRQKEEAEAWKAEQVARLGHDFTVGGDIEIRLRNQKG